MEIPAQQGINLIFPHLPEAYLNSHSPESPSDTLRSGHWRQSWLRAAAPEDSAGWCCANLCLAQDVHCGFRNLAWWCGACSMSALLWVPLQHVGNLVFCCQLTASSQPHTLKCGIDFIQFLSWRQKDEAKLTHTKPEYQLMWLQTEVTQIKLDS